MHKRTSSCPFCDMRFCAHPPEKAAGRLCVIEVARMMQGSPPGRVHGVDTRRAFPCQLGNGRLELGDVMG